MQRLVDSRHLHYKLRAVFVVRACSLRTKAVEPMSKWWAKCKNDCFAVLCDLNLWECHRYIEDNTWVSVDMEYIFEWSALYLTSERSSL